MRDPEHRCCEHAGQSGWPAVVALVAVLVFTAVVCAIVRGVFE